MSDSRRVDAVLEVLMELVQGRFTARLPVDEGDSAWDAVHAAVNIAAGELGRRTAELEAKENRFRSVFEGSAAPMVLQAEGRIVLANPAFCRFVGYAVEEVVGASVQSFTHPEDLAETGHILDILQAGGPTGRIRKRYLHRDGTVRWGEVVTSSHFERGVRVAVGVVRDIDAEVRLEEERQRLVTRVVEAQEAERHRVSRELHDALGQSLTNLAVRLRSLEERVADPAVLAELAELRALTRATTGETSRLAHRLRPPALEELGLTAALQGLFSLTREAGLGVRAHLRGLDSALPAPVETAVYRIVQEALTNVQRHAGATVATVLLNTSGGEVVVVVEDDGQGIDTPEGRRDGLGLQGIRDRARLLSGTMELESHPGAGTTLQVRLPLEEP